MQTQKQSELMSKDYKVSFQKYLKRIGKFYVRRKLVLKRAHPFDLPTKLQILLSSSMIKTQFLAEDLEANIEQKRFFGAMASIRMMLEELMVLTFVLRKLNKISEVKKINELLNKVTLGRRTANPQVKPFNILTVGEDAEKYLKETYPKLAGMYEEIYDFISEYVHPNGPSRHHFWYKDDEVIYIRKPAFTSDDANELYNYGCMVLGAYEIIHGQLKKVKLPAEVVMDID